ncbi:MAG: SDR family oxidoreductase [Syntrophobacteraceae bacterium]|nr:SDR family oxidoreductase [Syntrophobacteraceae bacterium]
MSRIEGSNILITGGASGIGKLMAQRFADRGGSLILWDIDDRGLEKMAGELGTGGRRVGVYHCDVSNRSEIATVAEKVKADFGKVDILINNAGIVSGKTFLETTDEQIEKGMAVNALAHFWTVRAFLPGMIRAGSGHIVTISSAAGLIGVCGLVDYCAAKFAVFGFDEALRMEIKRKKLNIRTTVVCPYFIDTGMFEGVRTRFSRLLPILNQQLVADRIVKAVEKNRRRLLMPPMVYSLWILRYLPTFAFDLTANLFGINATMEKFRGRSGE